MMGHVVRGGAPRFIGEVDPSPASSQPALLPGAGTLVEGPVPSLALSLSEPWAWIPWNSSSGYLSSQPSLSGDRVPIEPWIHSLVGCAGTQGEGTESLGQPSTQITRAAHLAKGTKTQQSVLAWAAFTPKKGHLFPLRSATDMPSLAPVGSLRRGPLFPDSYRGSL